MTEPDEKTGGKRSARRAGEERRAAAAADAPKPTETAPADSASPARLFATLGGSFLVILGIIGFFSSAGFGEPGKVSDALGIFAVNGWHNVLHIALGSLGLLAAGIFSRPFALGGGAALLGLGIWGFIVGDQNSILEVIPVNTADNLLHVILGALGLAAGLATPGRGLSRKSKPKPRTKAKPKPKPKATPKPRRVGRKAAGKGTPEGGNAPRGTSS